MRKLILQEWITLNGYAADKEGTTSFFENPELSKGVDDDLLVFIDTIDTILLGANTYKMFLTYWPDATIDKEPIADKLNATPKIVFSKSLQTAPWGKWDAASVVSSDAAEEIRKLKQQPGKDMVMWGSLSLAKSLMGKGLIDEYQIRICPVILDGGTQLFTDEFKENLELVETKKYESGLLYVRYKAIK